MVSPGLDEEEYSERSPTSMQMVQTLYQKFGSPAKIHVCKNQFERTFVSENNKRQQRVVVKRSILTVFEPVPKAERYSIDALSRISKRLHRVPESKIQSKQALSSSIAMSRKPHIYIQRTELKRIIESKSKTINNLRVKSHRLKRRVLILERILMDISKKKILTPGANNLLRGFVEKANEISLNLPESEYSDELKIFSVNLNRMSPDSYSYVRRKFGFVLPHPKALKKMSLMIDIEKLRRDSKPLNLSIVADSKSELVDNLSYIASNNNVLMIKDDNEEVNQNVSMNNFGNSVKSMPDISGVMSETSKETLNLRC